MSIADKITAIQNAKEDVRTSANDAFSISIPASAKLAEFPSYFVPAGCYTSAPTASGVYIKYVGGKYSDYNVVWSGKTPVGVSIKTSTIAFTLHPSEQYGYQAKSSKVLISGMQTLDASTYNQPSIAIYSKEDTDAAIASGYTVPAYSWARNLVYTDGSVGSLMCGAQIQAIWDNISMVNTALTSIGGTTMQTNAANGYWLSAQIYANNNIEHSYWAGREYGTTYAVFSGTNPMSTTIIARSTSDF